MSPTPAARRAPPQAHRHHPSTEATLVRYAGVHCSILLQYWQPPRAGGKGIFEAGCPKLDNEVHTSRMGHMNAAEPVIASTITEPLTWAEICERYPDEWVCVVDIDYDHPRVFDFRTARVVGHSKTKREAFDQASPWWDHYKLIGRYFTGHLTMRPFLRPSIILDDETRDAFRYQR
jgi:hypothetical protein